MPPAPPSIPLELLEEDAVDDDDADDDDDDDDAPIPPAPPEEDGSFPQPTTAKNGANVTKAKAWCNFMGFETK